MNKWMLRRRDLLFLVDTLLPDQADPEEAANLLASDADLIEHMLDDERLLGRMLNDEEILLQVSPWLFFTVLLRRTWRDLAQEAFTVEQRDRHKVVLFDVDQVSELLDQEPVRDYLAAMLASFTRIESVTVRYHVGRGIWRRYRTSELDIEGMMRFVQNIDEPFRFAPYKRIADTCLFLAGLFPEYIAGRRRYAASRQIRPAIRDRIYTRLEDYEAQGRAFYRLAAEHETARLEGLDGVLAALSERFVLAEKPLAFLSDRYLQFARYRLFDF